MTSLLTTSDDLRLNRPGSRSPIFRVASITQPVERKGYLTASEFSVTTGVPLPVDVDGEVSGLTHIHVKVTGEALGVFVPPDFPDDEPPPSGRDEAHMPRRDIGGVVGRDAASGPTAHRSISFPAHSH